MKRFISPLLMLGLLIGLTAQGWTIPTDDVNNDVIKATFSSTTHPEIPESKSMEPSFESTVQLIETLDGINNQFNR